MQDKTKGIIIGFIIGICVALITFALMLQMNPYVSKAFLLQDKCNTLLRQTCNVSNVWRDVVVKQQNILVKMNPNMTFPKVPDGLSCDKLL